MECSRLHDTLAAWEESGSLSRMDLDPLEKHLADCGTCAARYVGLLPFLRRDSGLDEDFAVLRPDQEDAHRSSLTESVMEEIRRRNNPWKSQRRFRVLLIAASLVLAAGISILSVTGGFNSFREDAVVVQFVLAAPDAHSVAVIGDFTEWGASGIQMQDADRDGVWEAHVKLAKGNVYTYNFVIDGETWIPDPTSATQVQDGFGGESSLLKL